MMQSDLRKSVESYRPSERQRHLLDTTSSSTTAVVAYMFDDTGELVEDGHALFYNVDEPLVMASTMKIVFLEAYAEAVASGDLDPAEQVLVADLEQYYLPMTDGGAHALGEIAI